MIVNGARLRLDPSGGLFWPEARALIVADLHFEKGSAYAARGTLLPPYDTRATLARLGHLVAHYQPAVVICLGDSFHDPGARDRLGPDEVGQLKALTRGRDWVWIAGNHDPAPPDGLGGRTAAELLLAPLVFRHEPRPAENSDALGEIAGHLHPKAAVNLRGRRVVRRCFAGDGLRLVLPALGAYAGGLDVLDSAFQPLFAGPFEAHLLGRDRVHPFPSNRLIGVGR